MNVFGVNASHTGCHVPCQVRAWPKKKSNIGCVLCEVEAKAEETVEHQAYNTL